MNFPYELPVPGYEKHQHEIGEIRKGYVAAAKGKPYSDSVAEPFKRRLVALGYENGQAAGILRDWAEDKYQPKGRSR